MTTEEKPPPDAAKVEGNQAKPDGGEAASATPAGPEIVEAKAELVRVQTKPLPPLIIKGVERLTAAEEADFGKVLHAMVMADRTAEEGHPELGKWQAAIEPLLRSKDGTTIPVRLTVLDSNHVNAFSHLGNYLYVSKGLLARTSTPAEFRFVVGHELAHCVLKHAETMVSKAMDEKTSGPEVGTLPRLCQVIAEGYSDEREFEADAWVIARMRAMGDSKRGCLTFAQKMMKGNLGTDLAAGHHPPKSALGDEISDLENHFRTGPAWSDRVRRIESLFKTDGATATGEAGSPSAR